MTTKINIESTPIRHRDAKVVWVDFEVDIFEVQTEKAKKKFVKEVIGRIEIALYNHLIGDKF